MGEIAKNKYSYERLSKDRGYSRDTEAGLSKAQSRTVRDWEEAHRQDKVESIAVVDESGKLNPLGSPIVGGSQMESSVRVDTKRIPENAIVTHNHPGARLQKSLAGSIGNSLGLRDMATAIDNNVKEIRAVTQNYIYSAKRPASGWGTTAEKFSKEYSRESHRQRNAFAGNPYDGWLTKEEIDRVNTRYSVAVNDQIMRAMSKKFGFTYSRRKR